MNQKTILIVEDEASYREPLKKKLELAGFKVLAAIDGGSGLEVLEKNNVDLVLLDLLMPQTDGISFLYHLKSSAKAGTPVIVITNLTRTAYPAGFNLRDFIFKANTGIDEVVERVKANV